MKRLGNRSDKIKKELALLAGYKSNSSKIRNVWMFKYQGHQTASFGKYLFGGG